MKNPCAFSLLIFTGALRAATLDTCDETSLRSAVAGGGIVTLNCDGTIALSETIAVTNDVVISAEGHEVTIRGANNVRAFTVNPGVTLKLSHLVVADGQSEAGGAIYNDGGHVHLTDCVLRNNVATGTNSSGVVGPAHGGAIYNRVGSLVLNRISIENNQASGWNGLLNGSSVTGPGYPGKGGGMYNEGGSIFGTNVSFTANIASGGGGGFGRPIVGITISYGGESAFGGALYTVGGTLLLSHCTISSNAATGGNGYLAQFSQGGAGGDAGGAALAAQGATVAIIETVCVDNSVSGGRGERLSKGGAAAGGAVWVSEGMATIEDSRLFANRVVAAPGQRDAGPGTCGLGGAIFNRSVMKLTRSILSTNSTVGAPPSLRPLAGPGGVGWGGAIHNAGKLEIDQCSFFANVAAGGLGGTDKMPGQGAGGAISSTNGAELTLTRSTFYGNLAIGGSNVISQFVPPAGGEGAGGAIYSEGKLAVTNVTLTANLAMGGTGLNRPGLPSTPGGAATGGGIFSSNQAQVHYATFALNQAIGGQGSPIGFAEGGNITAKLDPISLAPLVLKNSILRAAPGGPQCAGVLTDAGYNLASDDTCHFTAAGSRNYVYLGLGPLSDNGGPVPTMALLDGSAALDAADPADFPLTDERGERRPFNSLPDIGAFELHADFFMIRSLTLAASEVLLSGVGPASRPFRVQSSIDLAAWEEAGVGQTTALGTFSVTATVAAPGASFFRLIAP